MCVVCNKKFSESVNLKKHYRIHTGEKPYKCEICDKKFTQSGHLETHKRTHTGEKPFTCNICNKKFSQKVTLKRHGRLHSGQLGGPMMSKSDGCHNNEEPQHPDVSSHLNSK
jgi:uncharacterized Zn-finger protein